MAVKIKLKRLGKIRNPQYRIVVADARNKRDGRAIEEIGLYQPKEEPSLIRIDSERALYWLGVGAQPTDAVAVLLKITGDWQKFKGEPGQEGSLRVAEPKVSKLTVFAAAVEESAKAKDEPAKPKRVKKEEAARAAAEEPAVEHEATPPTVAAAANADAEELPSISAGEQKLPAERTAEQVETTDEKPVKVAEEAKSESTTES